MILIFMMPLIHPLDSNFYVVALSIINSVPFGRAFYDERLTASLVPDSEFPLLTLDPNTAFRVIVSYATANK